MRTYYQGPDATVTDTHFVWQGPTVRVFAIVDLADVRLVRRVSGLPAGVAVVLGFAFLGFAAVSWLKFGGAAAIPLIVAAFALALLGIRRPGSRGLEIRARYRGREVSLYAARDLRTFNQVARALRRAIERSRQRQYGLAAG
jgi:Family of unknown function (DUF6232)